MVSILAGCRISAFTTILITTFIDPSDRLRTGTVLVEGLTGWAGTIWDRKDRG